VGGARQLAAVLLFAAGTLIAIAYIVASRKDIEATTGSRSPGGAGLARPPGWDRPKRPAASWP
jgi:hypothetical protein